MGSVGRPVGETSPRSAPRAPESSTAPTASEGEVSRATYEMIGRTVVRFGWVRYSARIKRLAAAGLGLALAGLLLLAARRSPRP